jgi:putative FmdB family regulatory protein
LPTYEYACDACGVFDALRPIAQRNEPCACPACSASSPRVMLAAPGLPRVDEDTRRAHSINERSAHAPQCRCAVHAPSKKADGKVRGFPARRPWMISH